MFTTVLGKNIHYQLIGEEWIKEGRNLLVFLHEGLGSIPQWKQFPEKLSAELQLPALVYERVGYGQSDYWEGPLSGKFLHFEALVMLPELLSSLGFANKIIIFGHSDGGTIGLIHSSQAMPQLLGAIIEAPHVMLEQHSLNGIRKARELLEKPDVIKVMNRYQSGRAYDLVDRWAGLWIKGNPDDWDAQGLLKQIKTPLLLIQGENDDFGTYAQIDKVADEAQSEIIEVAKLDNCGHIPHLQQQEKVIKLTRNFIEKINSIDNVK